MRAEIPATRLQITLTPPNPANAGGPGQVYTAVIFNDSDLVVHNAGFTATLPANFSYVSNSAYVTTTVGPVAVSGIVTGSTVTWTPATTLTLGARQVLTLTFRLQAGCTAASGSTLSVSINYNNPVSSTTWVRTGLVNIPVGRGNLDVFKLPDTQVLGPADYGDLITWVVTVKNSGLGAIYGATVQDTGGQFLTISPPLNEVVDLAVNESRSYTVTGTVQSCNLSNVARAWWPCGNIEGDGFITNPVSSTAGILFTPRIPMINMAVSGSLAFTYCESSPTRTVTLTVTNSGGPAQNFRIGSTLPGSSLSYVPGSVGPNWEYNAGVFSFTGNSPITGTLRDSSEQLPVTLTFQVAPQSAVCQAGGGQIYFTPYYQDPCLLAPITGTQINLAYSYAQAGAPVLNVTKTGPAVVATGDIFSYTVTVAGTRAELMSGSVFVTDTLPADIELLGAPVVASGVATASGNTINWSFPAGSGDFAVTAVYTARAVTGTGTDVCGATNIGNNGVAASVAPVCPGCAVLSDTAYVDTVIQNNTGIEADRFVGDNLAEVCDLTGFVITNRYIVTGATVITWAGTVFTEAMGTHLGDGHLPDGATPLYFVPGTLSVTIVNSVGVASDYTADVVTTTTISGQLVISFTNLQATDAPTTEFTLYLTYTARFTDGALFGQAQQSFWDWSRMYFPGVSDNDCAANDAFNQAIRLTIARGNLTVAVSPQTLNRCQVNVGRIDVLGATPGLETTNLVVTFTASAAEIASMVRHNVFTYTGGLAALAPPTITSNSTTITFTFASADFDADGAIQFLVDIPCTGESTWRSGITYQSNCGVTYGSTATRDHVYLAPQLYLQVSPLEQTVSAREVLWNFSVVNLGTLAATDVVITNYLNGLRVTGYTATNSTGLSHTPIGPVGPAVFTFANLAPNEQRLITLTAALSDCAALSVTVKLQDDCLGNNTCYQDSKSIAFAVKNPYLRTLNDQNASLNACEIGYINFTVKNASDAIALYGLNITETLRSMIFMADRPVTITILNAAGTPVYSTTGFSPTVNSVNGVITLTWPASAANHIFDVITPSYTVKVELPVRTTCIPETDPTASPVATAQSPCGVLLQGAETAKTVRTYSPDLTVVKSVAVNGGSFSAINYANPGDTVVWRMLLTNRDSAYAYLAHNVILSDTWDNTSTFSYTAASEATATFTAPNRIMWDIGDMAVGTVLTFYITGTVRSAANSCAASTVNTVSLNYGCDDGCVVAEAPQGSADLVSRPALSVTLPLEPILTCGGPITVSITNNGAAAYSTTLTVTVPAGYAYSNTVISGVTPSVLPGAGTNPAIWIWDPITIPGRTLTEPYRFDLVFNVANTGSNGACAVPDGGVLTAALLYHDYPACTDSAVFSTLVTGTLDVLTPSLSLSKLPESHISSVGKQISWTISLSNTGLGDVSGNIVITDMVQSTFISVTASPGNDGAEPVIGPGPNNFTLITWNLRSTYTLPANGAEIWLATVTATLRATGTNRNDVYASASCGSGCFYTDRVSDLAFVSVVDSISKTTPVSAATVGDLITYTLQTTLNDQDTVYSELIISDSLPAGLGYVSATLVYTPDADGSSSTPVPVIAALAATPAPLTTGDLRWDLGRQDGSVEVYGTVIAMVLNDPGNQNGFSRTNSLLMSYQDDGGTGITKTFTFSAEQSVAIQLPVLHLEKTYLTQNCSATLLADDFNDGNYIGWTADSGWTVDAATGIVSQTANVANRYLFAGSTAWTDYSFSAMLRSTDSAGTMGLVFRAETTGGDAYRWQWVRNLDGSGAMQVINPGATVFTIPLSTGYELNRWYHVEVRVIGTQATIYLDGQVIHTENNLINPGGQIGLYASNQNRAEFDNVLVTRLGSTGCYVGANDLITYTLTVSNQHLLPGYNLVITDQMPAQLDFITSTWSSTAFPPDTNTYQPLAGATAPITWGFSMLSGTGTTPQVVANQQTLVITVSARVRDDVAANINFSNRALLQYTSLITPVDLSGYGIPTLTVRTDSGGSHSTGLQTANGGLSKTIAFNPPPTATLGTLVTYTLSVPSRPISATLYNVVVTDQLRAPRFYIEGITFSGGLTGATIFNQASGLLTATFGAITQNTQAIITVTTRISHGFPPAMDDPDTGDVVTNTATMTHANASVITTSNVVTTRVGEPALTVRKTAQSSGGSLNNQDGTALVTYTIRLTNTGNSPAYSVRITDAVPAGISVTALYGGNTRSEPVVGAGTLTWTINTISNAAPANVAILTYTARISAALSNARLTNTVNVSYTSLTETIPGVRPYSVITSAVITTALPSLVKRTEPITLRVGDVVTYHLVFTIPAGTVGMSGTSYLRDALPPGLHYLTGTEALTWTPPALAAITYTNPLSTLVSGAEVVSWTFSAPITAPQDAPAVITLSFRAQATGQPGGLWPNQTERYTVADTATLIQRGTVVATGVVTNQVIQPNLAILKRSVPVSGSVVGAGDLITYTLTVTNDGRGPAYGVQISDTLPAWMEYVSSVIASTTPPTIANLAPAISPGATGVISWELSELWGRDWIAGAQSGVATITVVARVTDTVPAFIALTNTARITGYSSLPGDVPGERPYTDGSSSVVHYTVNGGLSKTIVFDPPPTATLGTLVTYTLYVPAQPISATLYNVVVTDQLRAPRFYIEGITFSGGLTGATVFNQASGLLTATFGAITQNTRAIITVTTRISHEYPSVDDDPDTGDEITNTATMTHANASVITTSNVVTTIVGEPALAVSKVVSSSGLSLTNQDGTALLTYTIRLTNTGNSPAYSVRVTDVVPAGISVTALYGGDTRSEPVVGAGMLTWTINTISNVSPANVVMLTYTARISAGLSNAGLTNTVDVRYTSLTETIPGVRPYSATATATVTTPPPALLKTTEPITLRVGDVVTYHLVFTVPAGTVGMGGRSYLVDNLPPGVHYLAGTDALVRTPSGVAVTYTDVITELIGDAEVITWTFGVPITAPQDAPAVITLSFRAQATGEPGGLWLPDQTVAYAVVNTLTVIQREQVIGQDAVTNQVIQPHLSISKNSDPADGSLVGAGDLITYTLTVTNDGRGPAYGVQISDTLPPWVEYLSSAITSTAPPTIGNLAPDIPLSATGTILWELDELWGLDRNGEQPGVATITVVTRISDNVAASAALTNTVGITGYSSLPGDVPGERPYTDGADSVVHYVPSPSGTKTINDQTTISNTASVGDLLVYHLQGPYLNAAINNVVITDALDNRLSYVDCSGLGGTFTGCGYNPATHIVTGTWSVVPRHTPSELIITVTVLATATGQITNNAIFSSDSGVGALDPVTTTLVYPVVALSKTVAVPRDPVGAGDVVTYTLNLQNTGPWPAYDLLITDALPAGVTFLATQGVSVTDPATAVYTDPNASGATDLAWQISQLNVGGQASISFTARVSYGIAAAQVLTNSAWGWYDNQPGENPQQRGDDLPTVTAVITTGMPALALAKSADPSPASAGGLLTYTLTVTNSGIVSAVGVILTDVIPLSTTFYTATMPHSGPDAQDVITWSLGALNIGQPVSVTLVVRVDTPLTNGLSLTNTAWLTSAAGLSDTAGVTVPVTSLPQLHLLKSSADVNGGLLIPGDRLTYTLIVSNSGNAVATGVLISDTIPANTVYVPGSIAGGTARDDTGLPVLTWTIDTLPPNDPVTLTFAAVLTWPLTDGLRITNTAQVTAAEVPTPTIHTVTDTIAASHALALAKTVEPDIALPSGLLTYTLRYTVSGNEPVFDLTISDTVPAHTTFVSADPSDIISLTVGGKNLIIWQLGNFLTATSGLTQQTGLVTLTVRADSPLTDGLTIVNTARLADSANLSDTASVTVPVTSLPQLHLLKSSVDVNGGLLIPGDRLTYTLIVSNSGNAVATGVLISDTVPANTVYVPGSIAGGTARDDTGLPVLTWTIDTLPPNNPVTLTFAAVLTWPLTDGLRITNTAQVTAAEVPTPTIHTVTDTIAASHTLALAKTVEPEIAVASELLTYTLRYTVSGNEPVFDLTLSDTVPARTTFESAEPVAAIRPAVGGTGLIVWQLGNFLTATSGLTQQTGLVTLTVRADSPLTDGLTIVNTARLTDSANLSDTAGVTVPVTSLPQLHLLKSSVDVNGGLLIPGDRLTYTLIVSNSGNAVATGVLISDTIPANTAYVPGSIAGGTARDDTGLPVLTWTIDTLPPDNPVTLTFAAVLTWPLAGGLGIINTAQVTAAEVSTPTIHTVTDTIAASHTLALSKVVTPAMTVPGGLLTYSLRYTVSGNEPVVDLTLSDTVPARTTFVSADPPASIQPAVGGTGLVVWQLGHFLTATSGLTEQTGLVTLTVRAGAPLTNGLNLVNTALLTDSANLSDTASVTVPVQSAHTLELAKSAEPSPVTAGGLLTYSLRYTVSGNEPVVDLTLSDTVPARTTFVSADPVASIHPSVGGTGLIIWRLGDFLTAGSGLTQQTGLVTLVVRANANLISNTQLVNSAVITDRTGITATGSATTTISGRPHLLFSKTSYAATGILPYQVVTYTLTVTNDGNGEAQDVTVSDILPHEVSFVSAWPAQDSGPNPLVWNLGVLPAGDVVTIYLTVIVNPVTPGTRIANTGWVTNAATLTSTADTVTDTVLRPGLEIVKRVNASPTVHSATVQYIIDITNTGEVPLYPVHLTDTLPVGVTYVPGTASPYNPSLVNGQLLYWYSVVTQPLQPGSVTQVSFDARVTTDITGTYTNFVTVTAEYPGGVLTDTDSVPLVVRDPGVALSKQVAPPGAVNGVVTFTLRVTNIGPSTLDVIPLFDYYDGNYLTFTGAVPQPNVVMPGMLQWNDLTAPPPNGFGANLPPDQTFIITTVFGILRDITQTVNTAVISQVTDVYSNPTVPDEDVATIIDTPTAIDLRYFKGTRQESGILLTWATVNEVDNRGFEIWRSTTGSRTDAVLISDFIEAKANGTGSGAEYEHLDLGVVRGETYTYWLVDYDYNTGATDHGPVAVLFDRFSTIYLPVLLKQ